MKRRRNWLLAIQPVLLGLAALLLYQWLEPARRFEADKLPVLAVPDESAAAARVAKEPDTKEEPLPAGEKEPAGMNILVLGIDRRGDEASRADSIMLVHVNVEDKRVGIVTLPRDTRVFLPEAGWTKVNHAHLLGERRDGNEGGTQAMVRVVSNFFRVPVHYYVKTDFKGFSSLIDDIGGVEVELSQDVPLDGRILKAGKQQVDGETALGLARERFRLPNGDFDRQQDQIAIIRAIADKMLDPSHLTELPHMWIKIKSDVLDTNFTDADLVSLAWLFKEMRGKDITHVTVPGRPVMEEDPLVGQTLWYWEPDMDGVRSIREHDLLQ